VTLNTLALAMLAAGRGFVGDCRFDTALEQILIAQTLVYAICFLPVMPSLKVALAFLLTGIPYAVLAGTLAESAVKVVLPSCAQGLAWGIGFSAIGSSIPARRASVIARLWRQLLVLVLSLGIPLLGYLRADASASPPATAWWMTILSPAQSLVETCRNSPQSSRGWILPALLAIGGALERVRDKLSTKSYPQDPAFRG
jgi:hypothetical protein